MTTTIKRRLDDAVEFGHKFENERKFETNIFQTYNNDNNNNNKISNDNNSNSISSLKITKQSDIQVGDEDGIYCIAIHPECSKVVMGLGSGLLHIYDSDKLTRIRKLRTGLLVSLPLLAIKFYPCLAKDTLFTGSSNGLIKVWNLEDYNVMHSVEESKNQITSLDFTCDGTNFASVGKDACVRIYDSNTLVLSRCYSGTNTLDINTIGNDMSIPGHSGKIFSVKYHPDDKNVLVSASWDHTLKVWDMRLDSPVRTIYGPFVCGDGLDINHNNIVTASWKAHEALQIWDYRMEALISTLSFPTSSENNKGEYLYCGRFWDDDHVVAGGSGTKDLKMININANKVVGTVSGNSHPVQAVEVNVKNKMLFCGTSGNLLKKVSISD